MNDGTVGPARPSPFSLLIKPASAACNLGCAYCFYLEKAALYPADARRRMDETTLERLIAWYMSSAEPPYAFGWQGGEPTLMGLDFFRAATRLQQKYGRPGALVSNGLQTNGTLIDDALAAHLAEYRFLVGVSLDGPAELHDRYRLGLDGQGSFRRALRGLRILRRHNVEFNVLVLVSAANVERPREVYRFLKSEGIQFHQYIPCVELDQAGRPRPYSVSGEQWGRFLLGIFEEWQAGDARSVSVRHFDSIIEYLLTGRYNVCSMAGRCADYLVVEHNGDLYPCDFFVQPELKLGSLADAGLAAVRAGAAVRAFAANKSRWNAACAGCSYLEFCSGDCLKHRPDALNRPENLSLLCAGWKLFYDQTLDRFKRIALDLARGMGRRPAGLERRPRAEDECFCGSGRRYRNCHGQSGA